MRLKQLRISGFRAVAHCAELLPVTASDTGSKAAYALSWARDAFTVSLPVKPSSALPASTTAQHMMSAIMGPNSAGKSTILLAMNLCFGNTSKLESTYFHNQDTHRPILIEATLAGPVDASIAVEAAWQDRFMRKGAGASGSEITLLSVWTKDGRQRLIRANDGHYYKQTPGDRALCERLMPAFRMIWAATRPAEAAELKRDSLLSDLVTRAFQPCPTASHKESHSESTCDSHSDNHSDNHSEKPRENIAHRLYALLHELEHLLQREPAPTDRAANNTNNGGDEKQPAAADWSALDALEAQLSQGLAQLTPQQSQVRIRLDAGLPRLEDILGRGLTIIDDGAALPFEQHGLGLQRAFAISVLRAWCAQLADDTRDYIFAIEEPEIYLHPHATRTLLGIMEQIAQRHQVVFTTHANEFVNRAPMQHILMVSRRQRDRQRDNVWTSHVQCPQLHKLKAEDLVKVQRYLREDRSDMLFARAVLLVEGQAELFALPSFAATLGLNLDAAGVSVVFVNGIGNFGAYHQILSGFGIPHTILMDGDGKRAERERAFRGTANGVVILEHDFERELIEALTPERRQFLARACQQRRGKPSRPQIGSGARGAHDLANLGKPLVGRVAGELCTADEIRRMSAIVRALEQTVQLTRRDAPPPDAPA
ncbi:MAG: AAA family ATPase [Litorilinea sp.]